jgi:hypothetical protein
MAQPIPSNPAGLQAQVYDQVQPRYHAAVQSLVPARPAPWRPAIIRSGNASPVRQGFLLASALTGGLAVAMSLELVPPVTASLLGMGEHGAFYLLMAGIYLLASAGYAAYRTRLLHDLDQAPWDVRLLTYGNLVVGGAASVALVAALLVGMAILALVVAPTALMLRSRREQ